MLSKKDLILVILLLILLVFIFFSSFKSRLNNIFSTSLPNSKKNKDLEMTPSFDQYLQDLKNNYQVNIKNPSSSPNWNTFSNSDKAYLLDLSKHYKNIKKSNKKGVQPFNTNQYISSVRKHSSIPRWNSNGNVQYKKDGQYLNSADYFGDAKANVITANDKSISYQSPEYLLSPDSYSNYNQTLSYLDSKNSNSLSSDFGKSKRKIQVINGPISNILPRKNKEGMTNSNQTSDPYSQSLGSLPGNTATDSSLSYTPAQLNADTNSSANSTDQNDPSAYNSNTVYVTPPDGNSGAGGTCKCPEPEPCPPCGRCPEPAFECAKVPNYRSTALSMYLPRPILNDFSTFGN
jgi:hypothetical protein